MHSDATGASTATLCKLIHKDVGGTLVVRDQFDRWQFGKLFYLEQLVRQPS